MGAAIGNDGWLAARREEDRKRLAEQDGSLGTTLQILDPRHRLPATTQCE